MNLKLTLEQLDAIEQRGKNATPGPWEKLVEVPGAVTYIDDGFDARMNIFGTDYEGYAVTSHLPDADFIAASRTDVPNLVHDWRVLSQRVQELEKVLEWYGEDSNTDCDNAGHKAREILNKK